MAPWYDERGSVGADVALHNDASATECRNAKRKKIVIAGAVALVLVGAAVGIAVPLATDNDNDSPSPAPVDGANAGTIAQESGSAGGMMAVGGTVSIAEPGVVAGGDMSSDDGVAVTDDMAMGAVDGELTTGDDNDGVIASDTVGGGAVGSDGTGGATMGAGSDDAGDGTAQPDAGNGADADASDGAGMDNGMAAGGAGMVGGDTGAGGADDDDDVAGDDAGMAGGGATQPGDGATQPGGGATQPGGGMMGDMNEEEQPEFPFIAEPATQTAREFVHMPAAMGRTSTIRLADVRVLDWPDADDVRSCIELCLEQFGNECMYAQTDILNAPQFAGGAPAVAEEEEEERPDLTIGARCVISRACRIAERERDVEAGRFDVGCEQIRAYNTDTYDKNRINCKHPMYLREFDRIKDELPDGAGACTDISDEGEVVNYPY